MSYDNILKFLLETDPHPFVHWLLGESALESVSFLNTELNLEPIRADGVFFLETAGKILHLEFQTVATSNPPMPLRMLDYWVRLYRRYRLEIEQIVIFLQAHYDARSVSGLFSTTTNHSSLPGDSALGARTTALF
ncbi:hypothetical protein [Synechococcus sp. BDU 130192]|uniref:hypothetical protein n=1 Tax=Synechococcus sp. BDU 130192 TaxID=2042059 RepID=UPI0020B127C0|nr:hypothetical protein [Synechococcus sp. BDU 130192]